MTDPRNKMHDKRVQQEKKHQHQDPNPGAAEHVQPGKKPKMIEEELPEQTEAEPGAEGDKSPGSSS